MLSTTKKQDLKSKAHALKVVISVGAKGLTENVYTELEIALKSHELLKIKLAGADKDERQQLIEQILSKTKAELIQTIGSVVVIYVKNHDKKRIKSPEEIASKKRPKKPVKRASR